MGADILFGEFHSGLQRDKQADILLAKGGRQPDGGEEKDWELFDCELDPFEMINVYTNPAYNEIRLQMMDYLDQKMAEIGDVIVRGSSL